ncbi:TPA: hypothetical protein L6B73_18550, partial [Pseudomonas aeruginosa]|nr:hypothetical protein [Pseudomonas aeruginosa]
MECLVHYYPAPATLPAFPDALRAKPKTPIQGGGELRKRWKDKKGISINGILSIIKKGYRSLDVGRTRSYALIDQLSEQESVEVVCSAFDVARSCYYVHRLRRRRVDARRVALRSQVIQLFSQSRGSAGSRSIL